VEREEIEFVKIREDVWGNVKLFGLKNDKMDLWGWFIKIVSDVIVEREFRNYFKGVKRKFTNLSLLLKKLNNELWYFFRFELIKFFQYIIYIITFIS